jgi:hypothetical protein
MTRLRERALRVAVVAVFVAPGRALAHSGPAFPLISDRVVGPYQLSVWTDPDATADGSAGGQFWITIRATDGSPLPADTRALFTVRAIDATTPARSGRSSPVKGDFSRQFAALVMDHEGPYSVEATIAGGLGSAVVQANVDATYDSRPAPWLLAVFVMPFLAVGFLWLKLLMSRRDRPRSQH